MSLLLGACSKDSDKRDLDPEDHAKPAKVPSTAKASKSSGGIDSYYQSTCAPCHGADGKGDTPMGRSLRVADLSSAAWQNRASDDQIAGVIRKGKGKMPAFDMPPDKLDALVKKVRSLRRK